jgi:6-pyruvoyl-tetrahydropterin synthase related domain
MDTLSRKAPQKVPPPVLLSFAALLLSAPLILYGFPVLGHDGRVHLLLCRQFSLQFWSGELYPRWLMGTHHGFGSPTFFFYGPFPFFVTSLLSPLARWFDKPSGYVELGLSAALALWCSGLAAYLWLRRSHGEAAAAVGALVYLIVPYHVTVDLYMRAAFAEFWSFAWMPLILYFTEGAVRRRRYALIGLGASYALLVTTHLLTTVMFSPVPVAYALFLSSRGERLRSLGRLGAGLLLGIGLASTYLLPALDHQRYVSAARYLADPIFQWRNNFPPLDSRLLERAGHWPSFVQFTAILIVLSALMALCLAAIARGPARTFWISIAGASLFMMLPLSAPIWRGVPILANLQFPWRYQTVLAVATAALAALSLDSGRPSRNQAAAACSVGVALLWLAFFARMFYILSIQDHRTGWDPTFTEDPFLTAWMSAGAEVTQMERVRVENGAAQATVERWAPRDIRVRMNGERGSRLVFHQFYYPGWTAGAGVPIRASEHGLVEVDAPAGEYQLRLRLDGGSMEKAGRWVSALSLFAALLLAFL